jgi:hypothetical protein
VENDGKLLKDSEPEQYGDQLKTASASACITPGESVCLDIHWDITFFVAIIVFMTTALIKNKVVSLARV